MPDLPPLHSVVLGDMSLSSSFPGSLLPSEGKCLNVLRSPFAASTTDLASKPALDCIGASGRKVQEHGPLPPTLVPLCHESLAIPSESIFHATPNREQRHSPFLIHFSFSPP